MVGLYCIKCYLFSTACFCVS